MDELYEHIRYTQSYKDLIDIGCRDETNPDTNAMRLSIPYKLAGIDNDEDIPYIENVITIFINGFVRYENIDGEHSRMFDAIRGDHDHTMTLLELEVRLSKIMNKIFKNILDELKISDEDSNFIYMYRNTLKAKLIYLFNIDPLSLFKWIKKLDTEIANNIIEILSEDIIQYIHNSPGESIIAIKYISNNPTILEILNDPNNKINPDYISGLDLTSGLMDLGF